MIELGLKVLFIIMILLFIVEFSGFLYIDLKMSFCESLIWEFLF